MKDQSEVCSNAKYVNTSISQFLNYLNGDDDLPLKWTKRVLTDEVKKWWREVCKSLEFPQSWEQKPAEGGIYTIYKMMLLTSLGPLDG